MSYKKKLFVILALSVLVITGLQLLISWSDPVNGCDYSKIRWTTYLSCLLNPGIQIAGLYACIMFLFSLIFFFIKEPVYRSWKTFALWYLPITFLITVTSSSSKSGGIGGGNDAIG